MDAELGLAGEVGDGGLVGAVGLAERAAGRGAGTGPPPGSPLRQADRAYKAAIADLASQA